MKSGCGLKDYRGPLSDIIAAVVAALAMVLLGPAGEALAGCAPASPVNNASVSCTGTTTDQNAPDGYGSVADTGNTITVQSGAIVTGTGANGLVFSDGTVLNYGTIAGAGNNGIITVTSANVINSGAISAGNDGILAITSANVTNSGTISAVNNGISATISANVINSGTISGGVAALLFAGNPDTLTLLPGSMIIGAINLGGGGDTVNFHGGNHNLTFDTLAGATVTGTTPFAVLGNRAAAVDPTPFAMTDRNLMDFSRSVSSAIPMIDEQSAMTGAPLAFSGVDDGANSRIADAFASIPGLSAYASDAATFKNPTNLYRDGSALWARGFAGQRVQQANDPLLHTLNQFYGGMMGGDWQAQADLRLGAFLGGGATRSTVDYNYGDTRTAIVFGGAFARYLWGASFLQVVAQGGYSRTDSSRNINNNLLANGLEIAKASYDGWYISPEATYGVNYGLGSLAGTSYMLTPSLKLRYLYASFDGYTESGTTAPLTVGNRTVNDFEERGQLKLASTHIFKPTEVIMTSIYGGVLGVQRAGSTTIDATLLGQAIPFATPGKDDVWGGFGGAGLEWRTGRVVLYASTEYLALSDDSSVVSGQGGIRVAF